jgi:hypothetical protein
MLPPELLFVIMEHATFAVASISVEPTTMVSDGAHEVLSRTPTKSEGHYEVLCYLNGTIRIIRL